MPDAGGRRRFGQVESLAPFGFHPGFQKVLDGKERGRASKGFVQGGTILEVGGHHLRPCVRQGLRRRLGGVARQSAHGMAPLEEPLGDGAALFARRTSDRDGLRVDLRVRHETSPCHPVERRGAMDWRWALQTRSEGHDLRSLCAILQH